MVDLKIQPFINSVLHKPCQPIVEINDDLLQLINQMFIKMQENNGVGLAANQVGISKQLCVAALEDQTNLMAFINPKIIRHNDKKIKLKEGCLSAPGIMVAKNRYTEIYIECLNIRGDKELYKMTDFDARILQHEIDHLQGTMCISEYLGYCQPLIQRGE